MRTGLRQSCAAQRPTVDIGFLGSVFALQARMPSRCALFQCSLFLAKCRAVLDNHSTPFAVRQSRFPSECYQKNGSSSTCGENKKRTGHHVVCRCECRLDCQVSLRDCRQVPRTRLIHRLAFFSLFHLPFRGVLSPCRIWIKWI
jgi:hypothetical protein